MEEAKITGAQENQQSNSLLETDDLIMEIGRMHVEGLNGKKIIEALIENHSKIKEVVISKNRELEQANSENINMQPKLSEVNKAMASVGEHNEKLVEALAEVRKEVIIYKGEDKKSKTEYSKLKKENTILKRKVTKLSKIKK